jgi:hypothetical protein
MPLRWKIDNEARLEQTGLVYQHFTWVHFLPFAGFSVKSIIFGERFAKLKGDASPHDADAIYRIHECVCFRQQYVTLL